MRYHYSYKEKRNSLFFAKINSLVYVISSFYILCLLLYNLEICWPGPGLDNFCNKILNEKKIILVLILIYCFRKEMRKKYKFTNYYLIIN